MSDYISRETAKNALREQRHRITVADEANGYGNVKWSEYVIYAETAENAIDALPAADVKPVVRGKWMLVDTEDGDRDDTLLMTWWCNRCGKEFKTAGRLDFDFCPKCGADMREE